MNKQEAQSLLRKTLKRYRKLSYDELRDMMGKIDILEVEGETGTQYQVEVQVFWDNKRKQNIRVLGAIDDGGWRAFLPITDSFIVASDGTFIGE